MIELDVIKIFDILLNDKNCEIAQRKFIFWAISNICSGTDNQVLHIMQNKTIMNQVIDAIVNPKHIDVSKEACFVFSNLMIKKNMATKGFALKESTVDVLLKCRSYDAISESGCGVLFEAMIDLLSTEDIFDYVKYF
jgi:hypothetical protein